MWCRAERRRSGGPRTGRCRRARRGGIGGRGRSRRPRRGRVGRARPHRVRSPLKRVPAAAARTTGSSGCCGAAAASSGGPGGDFGRGACLAVDEQRGRQPHRQLRPVDQRPLVSAAKVVERPGERLRPRPLLRAAQPDIGGFGELDVIGGVGGAGIKGLASFGEPFAAIRPEGLQHGEPHRGMVGAIVGDHLARRPRRRGRGRVKDP